jgi:hypothetical protein
MSFKRKNEDAEGYPAVKRVRLMHLTSTSFKMLMKLLGVLGNTKSSAHSNLLLNDKRDNADDVLVLDTDKDLLLEMGELLNDLKL